jgi:hypothetical protein
MKRHLLFLLCSLLLYSGRGQTNIYHPFPYSNAVWCENGYWADGTCYYNSKDVYFIKGDSVAGGLTYTVLCSSGWSFSMFCGGYSTFDNSYPSLILQNAEAKRVYIRESGSNKLLYDFNLSLHDTLRNTKLCPANTNFVSSIDSVFMGEQYRKRFWISTLDGQNNDYVALIEGVGSTFGLFGYLSPPFESGRFLEGFSDTVQYNQAKSYCGIDVGIYEPPKLEMVMVFPNPVKEELTLISKEDLLMEINIYDITGRIVLRKHFTKTVTLQTEYLDRGVYFYKLKNKDGAIYSGKIVKE